MATTAALLFNGPATVDEAAILISSLVEVHLAVSADPHARVYSGLADGLRLIVCHNLHNDGDPRVYGRRWQATFDDAEGGARDVERAARRAYEAIARSRTGVTLLLDGRVSVAQSASGSWRLGA